MQSNLIAKHLRELKIWSQRSLQQTNKSKQSLPTFLAFENLSSEKNIVCLKNKNRCATNKQTDNCCKSLTYQTFKFNPNKTKFFNSHTTKQQKQASVFDLEIVGKTRRRRKKEPPTFVILGRALDYISVAKLNLNSIENKIKALPTDHKLQK